jgi:hypothetical protein
LVKRPVMKPRWDENEFNTPQEMFVRVTFLACLAAFTAGVLVMLAGAAAHDLRLVGTGALLLIAGGLMRSWLCRHGRFDEAEAALQEFTQAGPPTDAARVAELVRLLRQWEELESKRGSPGFDPWAVQAIRHDIRDMVEADPALEGLFHDPRRAA